MTGRKKLLAVSAAAALVAVTAGCSSGSSSTSSSSGGSSESTGLVQINTSPYQGDMITPVAKPTIEMIADTTGRPYDIRTMTRGVVTLLYFGYTTCPDQCPLTMANIAAALQILPAADRPKVKVLFITVDPAHDTLARLRYWLGNFNPSFIGLRGTLDQIQAASQQTGIPVGSAPERGPDGTYAYAHGTETLAYSTDNTAYESFFPSTPPASIAHDLALLVTGHHP
jgi:protein SCO1